MISVIDNDLSSYLAEATPTFICGMPKSGTTLLLALLDSHDATLVFPEETKFLRRMVDNDENENLDFLLTQTHCRFLSQSELVETAGQRDYRSFDGEAFVAHARAYASAHADRSPCNLLEAVVAAYGFVSGRRPPRYWVEKTPLNEIRLIRARAMWGRYKAIYIMRDPRDVFCSYNRKNVLQGKPSYEIAEFARMFNKSFGYWENAVRRKPRLEHHLVRYESLAENPDGEMRLIAKFLEIDYSAELLKPTRMGQLWTGNSMRDHQFTGVSAASVEGFRAIMSEKEIAEMGEHCGAILERFSYAR